MILPFLLLPVAAGALLWLTRKRYALNMTVAAVLSLAHLALAVIICKTGVNAYSGFAPYGFELCFRVDGVTSLYLLLAALMSVLLAVYSAGYLKDKPFGGAYQFLLWISIAMLDGALLSDHLALTLFFWEGLLCTLFGMLMLRNRENPKTAIKALTVSGTADLILMLGIALTISCAGTGRISQMSGIPIQGLGAAGFACLMAGALGKAGCMPFHSWIPDAAKDAPTPFLAAFPGALEKLAGIYLATRAVTKIYAFEPGSAASVIIMMFGAITLFGGVAMALIQKDMKRLLAYHAISQVGYIILGIGSGLAVGMAGGVYHLINNVLYKSGLFMVAGAVELCAGTTDLHDIGGLGRKMPVTTVCAIVFALSIAGFPLTNGFTSKELIFDAALEIHPVFYAVALAGAFMTAASFLKLTRAAFFGEYRAPKAQVKEAKPSMLMSAVVLALLCLVCAVLPSLPLDTLIGASYGYTETFADRPKSVILVAASCAILLLAVIDHIYGARKTGSALKAADHIHYLPGVKQAYEFAGKGYLDPYNWLTAIMKAFASLCVLIEKGVSWIYDAGTVIAMRETGNALSHAVNGRLSRYLIVAVGGLVLVGLIFVLS